MNTKQTLQFFLTGAYLGVVYSAQPFSIDSIKHDSVGGIITLRWETIPERVWSIESSTNLIDWFQAQTGPDALLRVPSSHSNRTEISIEGLSDSSTFYRVKTLPMTDITHSGTLTPDSFVFPSLYDVNDGNRVIGAFDPNGDGIGFTWAPNGTIVTFGPKSSPSAINNQHMVVGYRYSSADGAIFAWTPAGGIVEMGAGVGVDVNEAGHILGYETRTPPKGSHAFLWKPSTGRIYIPDLDPVAGPTTPMALSDAGHVVGASRTASGDYHAFIWTTNGGMIDLGGFNSSAFDVNTNGQVIGTRSLTNGGVSRGFFWSASTGRIDFPLGSYPADINQRGQVVMNLVVRTNAGPVSSDFYRGFIWSQSGGLVDLGTFQNGITYEVQPSAINELGQVIGDATVEDGGVYHQAFFWSPDSGMVMLETLAAPRQPGGFLINNHGAMFGSAYTANYQGVHAVMWHPILPP